MLIFTNAGVSYGWFVSFSDKLISTEMQYFLYFSSDIIFNYRLVNIFNKRPFVLTYDSDDHYCMVMKNYTMCICTVIQLQIKLYNMHSCTVADKSMKGAYINTASDKVWQCAYGNTVAEKVWKYTSVIQLQMETRFREFKKRQLKKLYTENFQN